MPRRSMRFVLRRPGQDEENEHQLHPLRKQYLENRLKDIDYQERQQRMQDSFTTALYGKKDYSQERNQIMKELTEGKQSRMPGYKYPDEKFWDIADTQNAKEKYPKTPEVVGKEISRFQREYPNEYKDYMKQIQDDQKSWGQIDQDINNGKTTPQGLSDAQWQTILDKSAEELREKEGQTEKPYCNIYTRDQLLKQGIYMPPGQNANQIKDHMDNNPQDWEKIPKRTDAQGNPTGHLDHQAAHDAAANGDTVVVAWKNDAGHGHVAQVDGNGQMNPSDSDHWGTDVPTIDGYHAWGNNKGIKQESLSQQFSKDKEPNMDYYRYVGERRETETDNSPWESKPPQNQEENEE